MLDDIRERFLVYLEQVDAKQAAGLRLHNIVDRCLKGKRYVVRFEQAGPLVPELCSNAVPARIVGIEAPHEAADLQDSLARQLGDAAERALDEAGVVRFLREFGEDVDVRR